jgi:hypothetical protein
MQSFNEAGKVSTKIRFAYHLLPTTLFLTTLFLPAPTLCIYSLFFLIDQSTHELPIEVART